MLEIFLLAILILVFTFLFVTMVFGRVWCGWFCPQTTLTDLAEFIDRKVDKFFPGKSLTVLVRHLCYLLLSFAVAANLVWYFIPPSEFFPRLLGGRIGAVAGITLVSSFVLIYVDLVLVRRSFCRAVCPYGRIQAKERLATHLYKGESQEQEGGEPLDQFSFRRYPGLRHRLMHC